MNAQDNKSTETIENATSMNKEKSAATTDSRRKFIQKAAAGTILTTLPASSVWGVCTVSGALSGGSQVVDNCKFPPLTGGGRSPEYWKPSGQSQYYDGFSNYDSGQEDCLRTAITTFESATTIPLDDGLTLNLASGLAESGSLSFHLSAAYLNAYYKFYILPITLGGSDVINTPEELVQHLYALTLRYDVDTVKTALVASYTDEVSSYSGFSC